MEKATRVLAFILAGGEGKRLAPLTRHIAKPAVPFHARHRLIDFALSNLRNSGIRAVHVLMQYQPRSVLRHLLSTWRADRPDPDGFVNPVTGGTGGIAAFDGTADAVFRNREQIVDFSPDVVVVFSADHIYRMDVRQMIEFHLACDADATVAALPVPLAQARGFGVIEAGEGGRIHRFAEKPARPAPMHGRPGQALASMGNYVFSPRVLLQALDATHVAGGTDFGGDLLPSLVGSHRLMAYDFTTNVVKGTSADADPHYWRDVGTIDAYFAAHMDTLGPVPRFRLANREWPIRGTAAAGDSTGPEWPFGREQSLAVMSHSAEVEQSILRQGVHIGERALVSRCIVADNVTVGARCRLRNVIVDQDNHLPDGFEAGIDAALDRQCWPVSDAGIVVIPRGFFAAPAAMPRRREALAAEPLRFARASSWATRGPDARPATL